VVREGVGAGGRNEPSPACTHEQQKKNEKKKVNMFKSNPHFLIAI
jgi:hypothetical protein